MRPPSKAIYTRPTPFTPSSARIVRESMGMSLRRAAVAMKITPPHLCDMELGRRGWTAEMQRRWEKVHGQPFPTT